MKNKYTEEIVFLLFDIFCCILMCIFVVILSFLFGISFCGPLASSVEDLLKHQSCLSDTRLCNLRGWRNKCFGFLGYTLKLNWEYAYISKPTLQMKHCCSLVPTLVPVVT